MFHDLKSPSHGDGLKLCDKIQLHSGYSVFQKAGEFLRASYGARQQGGSHELGQRTNAIFETRSSIHCSSLCPEKYNYQFG
jgi:hypothetical protein